MEELTRNDGRKSSWSGRSGDNRVDFKDHVDQAVLRVYRVAEELQDEEAIVFVLRFLLYRVNCPILLSTISLEALQKYQERYCQKHGDALFDFEYVPSNRLSIPLLECVFNQTCQL